MPESVYPGKYTIEAGKLNKAAGYTLVPDVDDDQKIRVYVLDDDLNKKPYGAHGRRYFDPKKAEEVLKARSEISQASCYMIYDPEVRDMVLKAEISQSIAG